jgi:hypothetical protein
MPVSRDYAEMMWPAGQNQAVQVAARNSSATSGTIIKWPELKHAVISETLKERLISFCV